MTTRLYTDLDRIASQAALREAKKNFRKNKRVAEKLKKDIGMQRLSAFFHLSKEMFWKKVNELKKRKKSIYLPMNILQDHYSKLFNSTNNISHDETLKAEEKVAKFINDNKNKAFNVKIQESEIRGILNDLGNGKSVGHMGLSNEHLKYCKSNTLDRLLASCYTQMFQNSLIPQNMNLSIIKPILKDEKGSSEDIANQRPIAVSDVFSYLLEKLILKKVETTNPSPETQFGFKKLSSCQHAVYVVNEMMKVTKNRKKKYYVIALDASKAFDKVEHKRLIAKLIDSKVDPLIIMLIISYYTNAFMVIMKDNEV